MLYADMVKVYAAIENTASRLKKTEILSEFLQQVPDDDLNVTLLLIQGRIFPPWDARELGLAAQLVCKALTLATGHSVKSLNQVQKESKDLGEVAEKLVIRKKQATLWSSPLTVSKVINNLRGAAVIEGERSVDRKLKLVAELFTSATPEEAKYITRTILEQLRIGLGQGTVRDAIGWSLCKASLKDNEVFHELGRDHVNLWTSEIQNAYNLANDFSVVALTARQNGLEGLKAITLQPGRPVKSMLFQKAKNIDEGFEIVGLPCACEHKYDGFRIQIHKKDNDIKIFTRRLENVTKQFPDIVEAARKINADSFILDAEAVGIDASSGKYLAFQKISQRIKRKHNVAQVSLDFPVEINVFDAMFVNKESLTKKKFSERRKILESVVPALPGQIQPSNYVVVSTREEAEEVYKASLDSGNEGMMMKNLEAVYQPGARVGFGIKIKPVMETLDVVIVGGEWGEGKRAEWISSFTLAVRRSDGFVEIGKMGTGLKEKPEEGFSFKEMTELVKPLIIKESGREVVLKPKIVIEVKYEEIQQSPTYSSGFALRFPRFVCLREDRDVEDAASIEDITRLYQNQRSRFE